VTVISVRLDGRLAGELRFQAIGDTSMIQIGNDSTNQPFEIFVDDVRVAR
jgi:hypothetical protein